MHKPDVMVGDEQKKQGIEIWFTSGLDVVLKLPWSIDKFWHEVDALICLSQIVFAQECDIEDDEE